MDNEKEISFGAFDSELMRQEIFIPEGFTATIDGNRIILKKIESEDERIKEAIIATIHLYYGEPLEDEAKEMIAWLEKQGNATIKWNKNTKDNKPQFNHSVLMLTKSGISEGEWRGGNQWLQYRWSGIVRDSDVTGWMELSVLEKQGEQKPAWSNKEKQMLDDIIEATERSNIFMEDYQRELVDWLKSLEQRIGG